MEKERIENLIEDNNSLMHHRICDIQIAHHQLLQQVTEESDAEEERYRDTHPDCKAGDIATVFAEQLEEKKKKLKSETSWLIDTEKLLADNRQLLILHFAESH